MHGGGILKATRSAARGNGIVEAFVRRLTIPKRRAPRPKGQRLSLGFRGTLRFSRDKMHLRTACGSEGTFARRANPKGAQACATGKANGTMHLPTRREKKLLPNHQNARKKKRNARLAGEARKQLERTTLYPPPMTRAATPAARVSSRSDRHRIFRLTCHKCGKSRRCPWRTSQQRELNRQLAWQKDTE